MLSFSMKTFGPLRPGLLTLSSFNRAVRRAVLAADLSTDLFYGHFLYPAAYGALTAALNYGRPAFAAVGEGTLWTIRPVGVTRARKQLSQMTGFLAVSSEVAKNLQRSLEIPQSKIGIFPNGVDLRLFSPRDPKSARARMGLSEGPLYISFVGNFTELKGVARLVEAVRGLEGVKLILAGRGRVEFERTMVAFESAVEHRHVADVLAASDLFVLPTCEEGSCNAVIEAMACGLPIVTSNGAYMDDLVDGKSAVRIDPLDVSAIRQAVVSLARDPLRRKALSDASLSRSRDFDINQRASRVSAWLHERMC
jgi:glycosyltransferase involved in cell wall biosynthesis